MNTRCFDAVVQFVYISRRVPSFDDQSLHAMVQKAQATNASVDVTGVLLHRGDWFMQLLEGPKVYVDFIRRKILADPRHTSIRILGDSEEIGGKRIFAGWSLVYKKLDEDTSELSDLMEQLIQLKRKCTPFELMQLMQRFH
ncbi:MAG: BLUF domain-containing protein [Verrucomicrobiota bacterium]